MPRKHNRDGLLAHALAVAVRDGIDGVTFGAVGKEADVPDRTVVYYFPSKADLLQAVIGATAVQILAALEERIGDRRLPAAELATTCFETLSAAANRRLMTVWLQVWSKAAGGEQPHLGISQALVGRWIGWTAAHLEPEPASEEEARVEVGRLIAVLDGALLLELVGFGAEAREALGLLA